jgi:hypothetical protein
MSYLILVARFNLLKSNGSSQLEQEASPLVEIDFQPSLVSRSTLSIKSLESYTNIANNSNFILQHV